MGPRRYCIMDCVVYVDDDIKWQRSKNTVRIFSGNKLIDKCKLVGKQYLCGKTVR